MKDIYKKYPLLFKSFFKGIRCNDLENLCSASYFYYHSILNFDSIIDDQEVFRVQSFMNSFQNATRILYSIFRDDSGFWNKINLRNSEFAEAFQLESEFQLSDQTDFSSFKKLAIHKSSIGKIAIDSLFFLSENSTVANYELILLSHDYFSIAMQLYDDLIDFKKDVNSNQFNWVFVLLNRKCDLSYLSVSDQEKKIYFLEIDKKVLDLSLNYFNKALMVLPCQNNSWSRVISDFSNKIKFIQNEINGQKKIAIKKSLIKKSNANNIFIEIPADCTKTFFNALKYIKSNMVNDYFELKHFMYLSSHDGFEDNVYIGEVFPRTIMSIFLIKFSIKNNLNCSLFCKNEIDRIIFLRDSNSDLGWSYFKNVKQIAPDIDDLAQVLILFSLTNNFELIDKYCTKAIKVVLDNNIMDNGGIKTWIINKTETPTNIIQKKFNKLWGVGPDVEVVANFLYALFMLDKKKYHNHIINGCLYIAKSQTNEGFWPSRWYVGNYYGTYVCVKLLNCYKDLFNKNLLLAKAFLRKSQNIDGGFSLSSEEVSDPLSTSFFLLTSKILVNKNLSINKAINFLILSQNSDGYWGEVNFIEPRPNSFYKSKVLTTTFCLDALLSWEI